MSKINNLNSILSLYQNPIIIYYHMVSEKVHPYYPHSVINTNEFKLQIRNLKKRFNIISLPEAIERADFNKPLKNSLVITIDDGFKECYSTIAPVLNDEKIPATFFLIESTIDNQNMMWQHQLEYLQQILSEEKRIDVIREFINQTNTKSKSDVYILELSKKWNMNDKDKLTEILWNLSYKESKSEWLQNHQPYMTINQIQELMTASFTVGSHSSTHSSCDLLNYDELEEEIIGSCKRISDKLGIEIKYFSYPFGRRARREFENRILEKSDIQCLIGGKPRLFRKNKFQFWEAYNFERNKSTLLYHLLLNSLSFK